MSYETLKWEKSYDVFGEDVSQFSITRPFIFENGECWL